MSYEAKVDALVLSRFCQLQGWSAERGLEAMAEIIAAYARVVQRREAPK